MDFRSVYIFLLGIVCPIQSADAAVTGWTSPLPGITATNGTIIASGTIAENSAVGTTLFTATATVAGTASYALTTDAGGKGTIDSSGVVTLKDGQSIDFETTPTLVFVVEATDSPGNGKGTATVTVSITNVNEVPAFSSATETACINDNSTEGTLLGTYTATDPDTSDTINYSIASGDTKNEFTMAGSTGAITVATGKTLSKAATPTYTLVVNAVDTAGPLTGTTTVSVTIGDCSGNSGGGGTNAGGKAPAFSSASFTACMDDNSAAGATLGTYMATDPDAGNTITYSIASIGNTNTDFAVDESTGVITVATGKTLSKATTATYALIVKAVDNATPPQTGATTISVTVGDCSGNTGGTNTDVNDAPAFSSASFTACIKDNSAANTTLGTYTAIDPDAGNTITYSISSTGNTNTDFAVDESTGVITVATGKTISKAKTPSYTLVVKAINSAKTPMAGTTTISVTVGDCSGTAALTALISLMFVALFATLIV